MRVPGCTGSVTGQNTAFIVGISVPENHILESVPGKIAAFVVPTAIQLVCMCAYAQVCADTCTVPFMGICVRIDMEASVWIIGSDVRIMDLAVKYGYDSSDSFTRAFTRFHGSTPTDVRRNRAFLKSFARLHVKLSLEGGSVMEYRMEEKAAFKVMGISRIFSYESANTDIPMYWDEVYGSAINKPALGMYGICFDAQMSGNRFRYMIADDLQEATAVERNLETCEIPAHTWAVFPCRGPMPSALQEVNRRIFSEWLPASRYELSEGYNIEYYSDAADYKDGTGDPEYYAEVWIPVKRGI